jgi:ribose/xylose/arabinose/galactoside ABC-type transport system permease subunit
MSAEADSEMRGSSSGRDLADASGQDSRPQELASVANSRYWKHRGQLSQFVVRYGISLVFVVLVASLTVLSPTFRRPENLWNILQQNSIIGVVSCGMLLMMIVGGFDLSVGSVGAASSIVAALLFVGGWISLGVVAALATGLVVGVVNGLLITKARINPFVATLGTQVLVQGVLFIATNAAPIYGLPSSITVLGLGHLGPVPVPTIIFTAVALITWAILRFTKFGHYIYAVGGNKEASRLAGVPVDRVVIGAFAMGGFCAAVGGLILVGQTGIGSPAAATTWPLSAIAAVVVGGTPLCGGIGTVQGAVVGTLLLGVVANGLNLFGVSPYWQPAVTGLVILTAVGIESYHRSRADGD